MCVEFEPAIGQSHRPTSLKKKKKEVAPRSSKPQFWPFSIPAWKLTSVSTLNEDFLSVPGFIPGCSKPVMHGLTYSEGWTHPHLCWGLGRSHIRQSQLQNPNPPSGSPSGILKSRNVFVSPDCCTPHKAAPSISPIKFSRIVMWQ